MDTCLLEFRVKPEVLRENKEDVLKEFHSLVAKYFGDCDEVYKDVNRGFKALFVGKFDVTVFLQGKEDGVVGADINSLRINDPEFQKKVANFGSSVRKKEFYDAPKSEYVTLPPVKRGRSFSPYDSVSGFLVERDVDGVVFDEISPYQHVRILHSPQYGNMLFLDNDLNLAESDLEYTRAITGFDMEDYKDKKVLILGGGDGGILHYLKDKGPSMITMIDIDEMVVNAARVHLRGICHDALDSLTGSNYEVIIDDCVSHLEKYIIEGRVFDYVINDLTAIPVSTEPIGNHWDFMRQILSLSMKVLKDNGKYFTQGNSQLRPQALAMYESQLGKLECKVKFTKKVVCVPSYLENWIFYTIWKDCAS